MGAEGYEQAWSAAETGWVQHFHPRSSDHHPATRFRCLYNDASLFVRFSVQDRFVRAVNTEYQSLVSKDSCVEFFVTPEGAKGYFNFEVNCGGTMLLYYIGDPERGSNGRLFKDYEEVPVELGGLVRIEPTMPRKVFPEIEQEVAWEVALTIPLDLFRQYVPGVAFQAGKSWRANFFKCADSSSHPHWASWSDIGTPMRFHQPGKFGWIDFTDS